MYPILVFSALLLSLSAAARADTPPPAAVTEEEVPVSRVLFPPTGYDSNDNIQVRIEGELPDPCYVLGKQTINRDPATGALVIRQFAWRRHDGVCDTGDILGASPFSEDVVLGHLDAGTHQIGYVKEGQRLLTKALQVEPARVSAMDNLNYARVSNVVVPDVLMRGDKAIVKLSGVFSSSCNRLKDPVDFQWQGNVLVVRPVELERGDCGWSLRYFEKELDLGKLAPGEYLVHVRARGGKAVQRTFWVLK